MNISRENFLKTIKSNIEKKSFHITVVQSSENPRFAYTIGCLEKLGFELIFAGGENYLYEEILSIFNNLVPSLNKEFNFQQFEANLSNLGTFTLSPVNNTWCKKMMLGVYDYYNIENFIAYQVLPNKKHFTLDIPNMSIVWSPEDIVWKWLDDNISWDLGIPKDSKVITELNVLFGDKVKEVMRWEENEWEAFTQNGENIDKNDIRILPITTLLGIDNTLTSILNLDIGKGYWRSDENSEWNDWG